MAHRDVIPGFKDAYNDRGSEIEDGDRVYWTVVAVAGYANDWAAYQGFADPESVATNGDKLPKETAEAMFPIMVNSGRSYRP